MTDVRTCILTTLLAMLASPMVGFLWFMIWN